MESNQSLGGDAKWALKRAALDARKNVARVVKSAVRSVGYDIHPYYGETPSYPLDFGPLHTSIIEKTKPYTLTPPERVFALVEAVAHLVRHKVPGSFVECGVWRGGSMMATALTLLSLDCRDRDLYLFDTFEGMPKPEAVDLDHEGVPAMETFTRLQTGEDTSESCYASLSDVQTTMSLTGYDPQKIHYVQGKVEDTIPANDPGQIALLRLDTDWYASTKHELQHLYPQLSPGGILIIDDYGFWQGARNATDEYIAEQGLSLFLNRVDSSARMAIKAG